MSAKSEAERYFKRRNVYWMLEKIRKKPVIKSPLKEMREAAAAECRLKGLFGCKDYSYKSLARILLHESPTTENEAINLLNSWYVGKMDFEDEYVKSRTKKAEKTKGERNRAAKPQKQCNSPAKKQKRRSGHVSDARAVPYGNSYKVMYIKYEES